MRNLIAVASVLLLALSVAPMAAQTVEDEKALDRNEGTPLAAPTDVEIYSGTNVGGPEWDRPFLDCSLSGLGPVRYSDQAFFIDSDGTCDITSIQSYDGYIHLYQGSWDPIDSCTNLLAMDDDGSGGIGTSDILGQSLTAGTYWVVTSAFSAGQEGTFDNTISCDVEVTLGTGVPTMGGAWMAAMILVLLAGGLLITRFRLS